MNALIFILGAIIWIPTLFIVSIIGGHLFDGWGLLGALCPVIALIVPGVARPERGGKLVAIAFATTPILMIVGSIFPFVLQLLIFGKISTETTRSISYTVATLLWIIPSWLIYRSLAPKVEMARNEN